MSVTRVRPVPSDPSVVCSKCIVLRVRARGGKTRDFWRKRERERCRGGETQCESVRIDRWGRNWKEKKQENQQQKRTEQKHRRVEIDRRLNRRHRAANIDERERGEETGIRAAKCSLDQNNTVGEGRASQERADDETASTKLPHANWRRCTGLASRRQATDEEEDDLILDDG